MGVRLKDGLTNALFRQTYVEQVARGSLGDDTRINMLMSDMHLLERGLEKYEFPNKAHRHIAYDTYLELWKGEQQNA